MNIYPFVPPSRYPGRPLDGLLDAPKGVVHEVVTVASDFAAALGFSVAASGVLARGRTTLWVFDEAAGAETGLPYGAGLFEFGLAPSTFMLACVRNEKQALQAALEGARCAGLGAVLLELGGESRGFDLTASRRLALACEASGTNLVALRVGGTARPSAALARWRVSPAPSSEIAARAPGAPAFFVRLERHRGGEPERFWRVEWDRDAGVLRSVEVEASLSRPVGAVSGGGVAGAAERRRQAR